MPNGYGLSIPLSIVESAARKARIRPYLAESGPATLSGFLSCNEKLPLNENRLRTFARHGITVYIPGTVGSAAEAMISASETIRPVPGSPFALDMTSVGVIDTLGIGSLIRLQRRATEVGSRLFLLNCSPELCSTLRGSRIDMILPIVRSIDEIPARS